MAVSKPTEYKFIPNSEFDYSEGIWEKNIPFRCTGNPEQGDPNLWKSEFLLEKDPNGKSPKSPGAKLDAGKIRPWLCIAGFSHALEEVARVTTKGAEKYTPNGWAEVPGGANRYMDAFGRHQIDYGKGEVFDNGPKGLGPDVYHKAQMIWNLLASFELELREKNGI